MAKLILALCLLLQHEPQKPQSVSKPNAAKRDTIVVVVKPATDSNLVKAIDSLRSQLRDGVKIKSDTDWNALCFTIGIGFLGFLATCVTIIIAYRTAILQRNITLYKSIMKYYVFVEDVLHEVGNRGISDKGDANFMLVKLTTFKNETDLIDFLLDKKGCKKIAEVRTVLDTLYKKFVEFEREGATAETRDTLRREIQRVYDSINTKLSPEVKVMFTNLFRVFK